jgi:hypothetical protein
LVIKNISNFFFISTHEKINTESCDNIVENIKHFIGENKKVNNEILKVKNSLTNIQAKESKIYEQLIILKSRIAKQIGPRIN